MLFQLCAILIETAINSCFELISILLLTDNRENENLLLTVSKFQTMNLLTYRIL